MSVLQYSQKKGFTLIEMLLAFTLFLVVTASLYLSMRGGIALYRMSESGLRVEHQISFVMNQMAHELRNTIRYAPIPFEGDEKKMSFPTVIKKYSPLEIKSGIATIDYTVAGRRLSRVQLDRTPKKGNEIKSSLLDGMIEKMRFSYGFFDFEADEIVWGDTWSGEEYAALPKAVKIELVISYHDSKDAKIQKKTVVKKIFIPQGEWRNEDE